jgi:hypothetical protein
MGKLRKRESQKSASSPRTSLDLSFSVNGPWDTAQLVWLRCSRCGCTNQFLEGDSKLREILAEGWNLEKTRACISPYGECACHSGIGLLPLIRVKRG